MSLNIFEIWDKIGRKTPFAVRRDHWTDEYYAIVERVECSQMPYGKAFGYPLRNGEISDRFAYDKQWVEEKLIPVSGVYQWTLVKGLDINKDYTIVEPKPKKAKVIAYSTDSIFDFGKYKGTAISEVFKQDPQYLAWALVFVDKFCLTRQAIIELETFNSEFRIKDGIHQINEEKLLKL